MDNATTATRIGPNAYVLSAPRIVTGLRFVAHGHAMEVVGEPITVGWREVSVRVREIGGTHDGNEFAAFLLTR